MHTQHFYFFIFIKIVGHQFQNDPKNQHIKEYNQPEEQRNKRTLKQTRPKQNKKRARQSLSTCQRDRNPEQFLLASSLLLLYLHPIFILNVLFNNKESYIILPAHLRGHQFSWLASHFIRKVWWSPAHPTTVSQIGSPLKVLQDSNHCVFGTYCNLWALLIS